MNYLNLKGLSFYNKSITCRDCKDEALSHGKDQHENEYNLKELLKV